MWQNSCQCLTVRLLLQMPYNKNLTSTDICYELELPDDLNSEDDICDYDSEQFDDCTDSKMSMGKASTSSEIQINSSNTTSSGLVISTSTDSPVESDSVRKSQFIKKKAWQRKYTTYL